MGNQITQGELDSNLIQAITNGNDDQVEHLLRLGANPNKPPIDSFLSRTALHHVALSKGMEIKLKLLLGYVDDIDMTDNVGNTCLHYACVHRDNLLFIKTLLKRKPNCSIQNRQGRTVLHNAVEFGNDAKTVELILEKGRSDPNIGDWKGDTPLHLCTAHEMVDPLIVGTLLEHGADPNQPNDEGKTALHTAAINSNVAILLLLRYNAKVFIRDRSGKLPSELAVTEEIRNILKWEEARVEDPEFPVEGKKFYFKPNEMERLKLAQLKRNKGGYGSLNLPGMQGINIPNQSLPEGTHVDLSIKQTAAPSSSEEIFYDIYLDITIRIPGILFEDFKKFLLPTQNISARNLSEIDQIAAITAMSFDKGEQWISQREFLIKGDGKTYLNFCLKRKNTRSVDVENKRMTTSPINHSNSSSDDSDSTASTTIRRSKECITDLLHDDLSSAVRHQPEVREFSDQPMAYEERIVNVSFDHPANVSSSEDSDE